MNLLLVLLLLEIQLPHSSAVIPINGMDQLCYAHQRDLNLGFISSLSRRQDTADSLLKCGRDEFYDSTPFKSQSVVYIMDKINSRSDLLPNISLGFALLDQCGTTLTAVADMLYMLPNSDETDVFPEGIPVNCSEGWKHFKVVGSVGPSSSSSSVVVGGLSSLFEIPLVLLYASSDELSDKNRYAYTMRLVPPDRFQAEAMIDLVLQFGWNYASLLYIEGPYGENGGKQVEKNAKKKGVCLAFRYMFPSGYSEADLEELTHKLVLYKDARVIITFIGSSHYKALAPYLARENLVGHFLWIGSDAFGVPSSTDTEFGPLVDGSLRFSYPEKPDQEFRKYFETVTPNKDPFDPYLRSAWEEQFSCEWNVSYGNRSCYRYANHQNNLMQEYSYETKIFDSVYIYAYALHAMITENCPDAFKDKSLLTGCIRGKTLYEYMLDVRFEGLGGSMKWDSKGDFLGSYLILQYQYQQDRSVNVGVWDKETLSLVLDTEKLRWPAESNISNNRWTGEVPESVCSKPCHPKEYYIQKELPCCWDCRRCRSNEILVANKTGCALCDLLTWPDEETDTWCEPIEPTKLEWNSVLVISLVIVTCFGLAVCVTVAVVFIKNSQDRLIKASSRQLMAIILIGIVMAYATVLFFLLPPTVITCYLSRFGFNLSVTFIYGPLMVKTSRIYRIFTAGKRGTKRPKLVGTRSQLIIVITLIIMQVRVLKSLYLILYSGTESLCNL